MCRRAWGTRSVRSRGGSIGQEGAPPHATPHAVFISIAAREDKKKKKEKEERQR